MTRSIKSGFFAIGAALFGATQKLLRAGLVLAIAVCAISLAIAFIGPRILPEATNAALTVPLLWSLTVSIAAIYILGAFSD